VTVDIDEPDGTLILFRELHDSHPVGG